MSVREPFRRLREIALAAMVVVFQLSSAAGLDLGERQTQVWVTQEWSFSGVETEGNPFDLEATVKFEHKGTGAIHITPMFYDGDGKWLYRFTPTFRGHWRFRIRSDHPMLHGHTGGIKVGKNAIHRPRGFLTHVGSRIAEMNQDARDLDGYEFNVFMDQEAFSPRIDAFGNDPESAVETAMAYLDHAKANGFEIIFISVYHNWFDFGSLRHSDHESVDPDLETFRVLEALIQAVYQAKGRVHIWAWGDESRKQTPVGLPGGVNGEVDRRLQRYIAARLGPLPGWTIGYGFDLHEWTNEAEVNAWADSLNTWSGWPHLLAARGLVLEGDHTFRSYGSFGREDGVETSNGGPTDFAELRGMMVSDRGRPHLLEERHTFNRSGFDLDMDGVLVRGFIDAVVETEDGLVVRDLKTGNNPSDEFQLAAYAVALEQQYPGIEIAGGEYHMVKQNRMIARDIRDWSREEVIREFKKVEEAVEAGSFPPKPSESNCRFCSVAEACEWRW